MAAKSSKGKKSTQRKLTAILSADVVGYSRLMGADEEATIDTLTAYRKVFVSEIKKHHGRVVDAKGSSHESRTTGRPSAYWPQCARESIQHRCVARCAPLRWKSTRRLLQSPPR